MGVKKYVIIMALLIVANIILAVVNLSLGGSYFGRCCATFSAEFCGLCLISFINARNKRECMKYNVIRIGDVPCDF